MQTFSHPKPGDWLTLTLGSFCVMLLAFILWSDDLADKDIITSSGWEIVNERN